MGPNSPGQKQNAKALDMISNTLPFHLGCLTTIGYRLLYIVPQRILWNGTVFMIVITTTTRPMDSTLPS